MKKDPTATHAPRWVSDGTGSADGSGGGVPPWTAGLWRAVAVAIAVLGAGCSPDMKDGLGPRVPLMNVDGEVSRGGAAAPGLSVSVRNPTDSHSIASARTGSDGTYAVAAPEGTWEVKVSGGRTGDFDSVTREFALTTPDERLTVPTIDVSAMGAAAALPVDSASMTLPAPGDSVRFSWTAPSNPVRSARVQVYDQAGIAVWFGDRISGTTEAWAGSGNQGTYDGQKVTPGLYQWRVKFQLADSSEARLRSRSLRLQ